MRTLPLQPPVASIESLFNLLGMTNNLLTIPGYRIIEQIYNGSRTQVYRGLSESNQKVIIKLLLSEYPTFSELVQLRNQYTITKNLDLRELSNPLHS
jgi:hypothetical protein